MPTTNFSSGTVVSSSWLNDVNDFTYEGKNLNGTVFGVKQYGAVGDNTTDDTTALQAAIDAVSAAGGGILYLESNKTYKVTNSLALKAGVILDGNLSRINFTLGSGNVYGLRVVTNSGVQRTKLYVISSTSPSSQYIFHSPISIGAPNNNGDTVGSPDPYQTAYNWFIDRVELGNVRQYGPVIQGMGNIYNGVISNVYIPSSTTCSGIHLDWGNVGYVSSGAIPTTKTDFLAGNCYTTHPHNIVIKNVLAGNLSVAASFDLGSSIVRLSGCYNIKCSNLEASNVTLTGFRHVGGDLGFEFAPSNIKELACKGTSVEHLVLTNMQSNGTAYGAYIDTYADNISDEQYKTGYVPLLDPLMQGEVSVTHCVFIGPNADNQYGVRITQARGVTVEQNSFKKWKYGVWVDEFTKDIKVLYNTINSNREYGILVGFAGLRENTSNVTIRGNNVYNNGTVTNATGIYVARGKNISISENTLGVLGETTQTIGISVANVSYISNISVNNNIIAGAASGGSGIALAGSTPVSPYYYRSFSSVYNNMFDPTIQTKFGGIDWIPNSSTVSSNKNTLIFSTGNSGNPSAGIWYKGDLIHYNNVAAAGVAFTSCTTSGTFGTLTGVTASSNSTNNFTMTVSSKTCDTVLNTYTLTNLSNTTGLREGIKISVAAAGIINATVLGVSGTTVTLDTRANATLTGTAVISAGVIEGEVVSIALTPAISSAIVMSVNGTTVVLDTAASSTESSKAVSYTTPVFKAHAVISA